MAGASDMNGAGSASRASPCLDADGRWRLIVVEARGSGLTVAPQKRRSRVVKRPRLRIIGTNAQRARDDVS
jgi:hypothetical protein